MGREGQSGTPCVCQLWSRPSPGGSGVRGGFLAAHSREKRTRDSEGQGFWGVLHLLQAPHVTRATQAPWLHERPGKHFIYSFAIKFITTSPPQAIEVRSGDLVKCSEALVQSPTEPLAAEL